MFKFGSHDSSFRDTDCLKAGVAWYGRLVGQPTELQPRYPVDVAAELKAPVLGLYGEKDQGIPLEDVEKMRAALAAAKQPSEIVVFPDAPHGFHADYRPSFREAAAAHPGRRSSTRICMGAATVTVKRISSSNGYAVSCWMTTWWPSTTVRSSLGP